jgi:hypothetical protein
MPFRFRLAIGLTALVAALGWGAFAKTYFSRATWREQALAAAHCVASAHRAGELAQACVAPNQLLNYNLGQVNDIRINLAVGVQKLADVMIAVQEKTRELSGLEAKQQKLTADVGLLNEQIQARCTVLGQPSGSTDKSQAQTPSNGCP